MAASAKYPCKNNCGARVQYRNTFCCGTCRQEWEANRREEDYGVKDLIRESREKLEKEEKEREKA